MRIFVQFFNSIVNQKNLLGTHNFWQELFSPEVTHTYTKQIRFWNSILVGSALFLHQSLSEVLSGRIPSIRTESKSCFFTADRYFYYIRRGNEIFSGSFTHQKWSWSLNRKIKNWNLLISKHYLFPFLKTNSGLDCNQSMSISIPKI